jgi:hypothetical protein
MMVIEIIIRDGQIKMRRKQMERLFSNMDKVDHRQLVTNLEQLDSQVPIQKMIKTDSKLLIISMEVLEVLQPQLNILHLR